MRREMQSKLFAEDDFQDNLINKIENNMIPHGNILVSSVLFYTLNWILYIIHVVTDLHDA